VDTLITAAVMMSIAVVIVTAFYGLYDTVEKGIRKMAKGFFLKNCKIDSNIKSVLITVPSRSTKRGSLGFRVCTG